MKVSPRCVIILALILGTHGLLRSKRAVNQFGNMISALSNLTLSQINGYGNYCGILGSGTPVDNLDRCCEGHDKCLKHVNRKLCLPLFYLSFFVVPYRWQHIPDVNIITCSASNNRCQKGVCECDITAAVCIGLYQNEYNSVFKRRFR